MLYHVLISVLLVCEVMSASLPVQTEHWFETQQLNHFDSTDHRVFKQRYFEIDQYWNKPYGPILLYICGEYTCEGVTPSRMFPVDIAKEFNAKIVTVEHRFFGKTQPFDNLANENLKYLNTKQALADLAYFIESYQRDHINAAYNLSSGHLNQWVSVGGSYPGALSAWFRLKYPHLVVGSLASSAVVNAIFDFQKFDYQVAKAVGKECADLLRLATRQIEENVELVKPWFNSESLSDHDFWYLVADAGAEGVQYGHRELLCEQMMDGNGDSDNLSIVRRFANYTTEYWQNVMGNDPKSYNSVYMSNPSVDPLDGGRQWWWMTCAELAYFQTAPLHGSIRSRKIDLNWHKEMCEFIFGESVFQKELTWPTPVEDTNNFYGATNFQATNVVFTNGIDDPWQWASIREPRSDLDKSVKVLMNNCEQCGHCQDLHTSSPDDSAILIKNRKLQIKEIGKWLKKRSLRDETI